MQVLMVLGSAQRIAPKVGLVLLFVALVIKAVFAPIIPFLCMLGRNSLPVFCMGSLLSLSGQISRLVWKGSVGADTVVLIVGIAIMALTAWLAEWRDRARDRSPARPPPQSAPASS